MAADEVLTDSDDDQLVEAELQQKLAMARERAEGMAAQAESKRAAESDETAETGATEIQRSAGLESASSNAILG